MKLALPLLVAFLASTLSLLAAEGWESLSDPQQLLKGWHIIGKGKWEVVDGVIRGTNQKTQNEYGHLVTDKNYTNFTVRLRFKAIKGNSGFYFRVEERGFSGVSGLQAEIDPDKDTGGLYETNGRNWVEKPTAEDVKKWFKPGEWNEMIIEAQGRHVVVKVNGQRTAELNNDPGRTNGKLALQVHGGQDVEVWFKDMEIKVQ